MRKMQDSGFTLLEVMIAISLLSFVLVSVISTTNNSIDMKERVTSEDKYKLQLETAMEKIDWDFSQIYTPLYFSRQYQPKKKKNADGSEDRDSFSEPHTDPKMNRFSGRDRYSFLSENGVPVPKYTSEDKHKFTFLTSSNRRLYAESKESMFAWVRYELVSESSLDIKEEDVEGENQSGEYALVRTYSPMDTYNNDHNDFDKMKPQVLLTDLKSLQFFYWDKKSKKYVERLSQTQDKENLVWAIKMELTRIDPQGIEYNRTRYYRTLWPYFEPENLEEILEEEKKKYEDEQKKKKKSSNNTNSSGGA